jgi:FG-GAP-like repeat/IPT/TIG domain/FG-GAP repeat
VRTILTAVIVAFLLAVFCQPLAAQNNPAPFLNDPVAPSAKPPGGPGFTLTVNGAGFVSGSTIKWNGSARSTTFVSNTQLTAAIPPADIATAGTALVTVTNPAPGGGVSNVVPFLVTTPTTSLAFTRSDSVFENSGESEISQPAGMAAAVSPAGNTPTLSVANSQCPTAANCLTKRATISTLANGGVNVAYLLQHPGSIAAGDFNGDGIPDLITLEFTNISFSQGNPDGSFQLQIDSPLPTGVNSASTPAVGDFNRDGHLDVVLAGDSTVYFMPGNGDGTFGSAVQFSTGAPSGNTNVAAGDFNGDGILDLAATNEMGNSVSILLGNGDGTFQPHVDYPTGAFPEQVVTGDFNGDGKLDLAVINALDATVSILLGNGDGAFQAKVDYPAGISPAFMTLGDFNEDGIPDLGVSDSQCTNSGCAASGSANLLIGNGDGTFQSHLDFAVGAFPEAIVSGDFVPSSPPSGRMGFAVANYQDSTVTLYSPLGPGTGPANPVPTISSISPEFVIQGSGPFTLTVNGTNFVSGSTITFGGQTEATTFVNSTQLTAGIPGSAVAAAGPVSILVFTPSPGGGNSTSTSFSVYLPPPTISLISPPSALAGSPGFTLTVNGANFVDGAMVNLNGSPRSAAFVSSTQITTLVLSTDVANQGTVNISVTIPFGVNNSGGGTSPSVNLTILPANSQPTIGSLVPASTTAGSPSFTLTIAGSGFGPSSAVKFGSNPVNSAYQNPAEIQAAIPASAVALAGTPLVTVTNPGSSPSVVASFTVNNPVPAATSLSPVSAPAGNAALTLTVTGANFVQGSTVEIGNSPRATTYVNATTLTASLPASDFTHSGTLSISVSNPSPGGGTTGSLSFTVADYTVSPSTTSMSIPAGQKAIYTLNLVPANAMVGGTVVFSATGLPAGASASFTPPSVPAGTGATPVTLSITTTAHSSALTMRPSLGERSFHYPLYGFGILIIWLWMAVVLWTASGRALRLAPVFLATLLLAIAAGLAACGGGSSSPGTQLNPATGTPAGTYPITVDATEGNVTIATSITLIVK